VRSGISAHRWWSLAERTIDKIAHGKRPACWSSWRYDLSPAWWHWPRGGGIRAQYSSSCMDELGPPPGVTSVLVNSARHGASPRMALRAQGPSSATGVGGSPAFRVHALMRILCPIVHLFLDRAWEINTSNRVAYGPLSHRRLSRVEFDAQTRFCACRALASGFRPEESVTTRDAIVQARRNARLMTRNAAARAATSCVTSRFESAHSENDSARAAACRRARAAGCRAAVIVAEIVISVEQT